MQGLTLDTATLAKALSFIPLHEVLGLDLKYCAGEQQHLQSQSAAETLPFRNNKAAQPAGDSSTTFMTDTLPHQSASSLQQPSTFQQQSLEEASASKAIPSQHGPAPADIATQQPGPSSKPIAEPEEAEGSLPSVIISGPETSHAQQVSNTSSL